MDIISIAGTAAMVQAAQTREGVSTKLIKMARDQQQQMVNMLAQSAENASQIIAGQNVIPTPEIRLRDVETTDIPCTFRRMGRAYLA
jgi:hypothetical protein